MNTENDAIIINQQTKQNNNILLFLERKTKRAFA
jgi:hypothetical protein